MIAQAATLLDRMSPDDSKIEQAVAAWRQSLGPERVSAAPQELDGYARTTLARAPSPAGVIRVRSRDEVVEAVRIANECEVPLYPISRGKNWGYGDACPVGPGQFVLDLSQMDRIVEVDPDLAYAVIEPGVTQRQLHAHLDELGYPLWMSCTASSPDTSVVGNMIERGFGATPYSDHAAHACGLEVVLADGTVVKTGLQSYPNVSSGHVYRWGLGPHLDGLFTQSNLGVVVSAGIWLMPRTEAFTTFSLAMERDDQLEEAIDRLRRLRLAGTLRAPVFIENAVRTLANLRQYPWEETGGTTPLSDEMVERLLREEPTGGMGGLWSAGGSLYGSRRQVRAAARDTRTELRGLGRVHFFSPSRLDWADRVGRALASLGLKRGRRLQELVSRARAGMDTLRGVPSAEGLAVSRWRLRRTVEGPCEDPAREGAGLYWLAPVSPAKGSEVRRCVQLIEKQMLAAGFDPLIRIAVANDRAVIVTTLLTFDRDDSTEAKRAGDCHRELTAGLIEAGFPPYRAGVTSMDLLDPDGAGYWRAVSTLKRALDPQGILAPGRYEPEAASEIRTAGAAS